MKLILDFETANTAGVDLAEVGADVYARHPKTEILCLCVMDEDGKPLMTWRPGHGINWLNAMALDSSIVFEAHNAAFEQMIWRHVMHARYGLPLIPIYRWSCTMARAYAHGMPGSLDKLASALRLPDQKDQPGADLTYGLSKPITKLAWNTPETEGGWRPADWSGTQKAWADDYKPIFDRRPATLARVERYCMQDCRVEWAAGKVLPELSEYERQVWIYDQVINQRGVKIDRPFVEATVKILDDAKDATLARFAELTGGLRPKQVAKLRDWLAGQGVELPDLAAATVDGLLGGEDAQVGVVLRDGKLPPVVHEVLSLRRLLGASAIEKFPRMLKCAAADGRARYTIQYHGAGTGRWAGRLFQPQNFPRVTLPDWEDPAKTLDPEVAVGLFLTGDYRFVEDMTGMSAIKAAGRVLRHALVADTGREYHSADFAGIEARIVLALAGQADKCAMLAAGADAYLDFACQMFHQPPGTYTKADKDERQKGKGGVLGCGFQCGPDNFNAKFLGGRDLETAILTVDTYRKQWAPKVPKLWRDLEDAALEAVVSGDRVRTSYGVSYELDTSRNWLICALPDGQRMWYREPRVCTGRFDNPAWEFKTWKEGQWKRVQAYGGLLTENVVQKLARGLLCEAIWRLEENGFPVVLTVHDEILAEPEKGADHDAFEQIMSVCPEWAANLKAPVPIAVEGWCGGRYRK